MSNLEQNNEFRPRAGSHQTLKYRPHLKWTYYSLLGFASVIFLVIFGALWPAIVKGGAFQVIALLVIAGFMPMILFLQAHFMIRPLAYSTVEVFEDRIEIFRINKKIIVLFSQITKLSYVDLLRSGGWFTIEANGKSYRFTVVLQNSEAILEAIAVHSPQLIDFEKMLSYRRTSISSDLSWDLFYSKLHFRKYHIFKYLFVPTISAYSLFFAVGIPTSKMTAERVLPSILIVIIVQIALAFLAISIVSLICDFNTRRNLKKDPNRVSRDIEFDAKIDLISQAIQVVIFLIPVALYLKRILGS